MCKAVYLFGAIAEIWCSLFWPPPLYIHQKKKMVIINETQTPPLWIWFAQFLLNDIYAMKRVSVLVGGNHTINQSWMFRK